MSTIRLILVDDHEIVRIGLRMLLQAQPDIEIVAEASSGEEAIELVQTYQPDVVLMDVTMPGMSGMEATRQLRASCPAAAILALTIHEEEDYFFQMLEAGASGYIPKRVAADELIRAIRTVFLGEVFLHSSLAGVLVKDFLQQGGVTSDVELACLTEREQEVLTLIAKGLTNKQIGQQLDISPKTVARHRDNVANKLHLSNRAELARYAIQKGLITLSA
ncbi:MAG: response regulator transcription factor [Anaerolineae bacterium]|jgi:two-component system response regulator NreC